MSALNQFTVGFLAIPSVNKHLVIQLARCEYVDRRENVIAVRDSGTDKTHVALGFGLAAIQRGLSVGFATAASLVHELIEARDERRLLALQKRLARLNPNPPMRSGLGVGARGEGRGTRRSALDSDKWGRWRPLVVVGGADGGPGQRHWGGVGGTACRGKTIADRADATLWGGWVVWWTGQAPSAPSGRQWQGSQSSQGASELGFPRPALGKMQCEATR